MRTLDFEEFTSNLSKASPEEMGKVSYLHILILNMILAAGTTYTLQECYLNVSWLYHRKAGYFATLANPGLTMSAGISGDIVTLKHPTLR